MRRPRSKGSGIILQPPEPLLSITGTHQNTAVLLLGVSLKVPIQQLNSQLAIPPLLIIENPPREPIPKTNLPTGICTKPDRINHLRRRP